MGTMNTVYLIVGVAIVVIGFAYAIWDEFIK